MPEWFWTFLDATGCQYDRQEFINAWGEWAENFDPSTLEQPIRTSDIPEYAEANGIKLSWDTEE